MKRISKMTRAQAGFTLIEIAIVLVIIGLLLGGVLQGQQLIENSRVRQATNTFNGVAAGAFSYQDRYGRLPGDDGDLAALNGRGGSWTQVTLFGDVNGSIDVTLAQTFTGGGEEAGFFQHLRAAGFISGNPGDIGGAALPQNSFGGLVGLTNASMGGGLAGTKVCMGNVTGSAAIALDTQLDDGSGATGRFRATDGAGGSNAAPAATALVGVYSEDNTYTVCYRI
jgi:prepilin-type N-terminal cleavage/methylation domain-containing protein